MPVVYLGQNEISKEYVDSYQFNKMYLGTSPLFLDGYNAESILTDGLYLRYDTSRFLDSYVSGSSVGGYTYMNNIAPSSSLSDVQLAVQVQVQWTNDNQGAFYLPGNIGTNPIQWYPTDVNEVNTWMGMKSGAQGNSVTHNIWIKPLNNAGASVRQYVWRVGDQYGIYLNSEATDVYLWYYKDGNYFIDIGSSSSITPNAWNNITITANRPAINNANTVFNAYVNGAFIGSASEGLSGTGAGEFVIGKPQITVNDHYLKGYFTEYTFYNRILSAGEIRYNYQTQLTRYQ